VLPWHKVGVLGGSVLERVGHTCACAQKQWWFSAKLINMTAGCRSSATVQAENKVISVALIG